MKLLQGKLVLLLVGLLVGAGAAIGATSVLGLSLPGGAHQAAETGPGGKSEAHAAGIVYPIRERIVNLSDAGIMRYLKTSISLELVDPSIKGEVPRGEEYKKKQDELTKELRGFAPIIEDQIVTVLSAKTSAELMTPEGKQKLKNELKERLNRALGEERVLAVYFSDFIIQ